MKTPCETPALYIFVTYFDVVKREAVRVLFVMCLKCQDHRQIRVFVATRQYFAEADAARVLGRIAENMCHLVQGFTEFRSVPES
jgi:hypothetical protein